MIGDETIPTDSNAIRMGYEWDTNGVMMGCLIVFEPVPIGSRLGVALFDNGRLGWSLNERSMLHEDRMRITLMLNTFAVAGGHSGEPFGCRVGTMAIKGHRGANRTEIGGTLDRESRSIALGLYRRRNRWLALESEVQAVIRPRQESE